MRISKKMLELCLDENLEVYGIGEKLRGLHEELPMDFRQPHAFTIFNIVHMLSVEIQLLDMDEQRYTVNQMLALERNLTNHSLLGCGFT